jgi:ATP-binding cassette subfamily C protein
VNPAVALPTATTGQARRRIVGLLAARRGAVVGVLGLMGASTTATLAGPALIGVVVDVAMSGGARSTIDRAAIAYAVLVVVSAALQYVAAVRAAVVGEGILHELRTDVFDHAVGVPIEVLEAARSGDLVSRLTGDVTVLTNAVRWTVPAVVFAVIEVALTLGALVLVDWRLAVVAVAAGALPAGIGGAWYFRRAPARYRAEREAHASLAGGLLGAYRGRTTLAAHRATRRFRHITAGLGRGAVDAELATTSARNRLRPSVSASLALALAAVVATGAALVDGGAVTVGAVSAAALYVIRLFDPIGTLLEEADEIQQATAATARLVGVTQLPSNVGDAIPRALAVRSDRGVAVELRSVDFEYEPGRPVLSGITLEVAPGEHVAVVGPSGAGKSTIASLVVGARRPQRGEVLIAGRPVATMENAERAALVALVAQDGHVFARSVADNVRLARLGASADEVRRALDAVDALAWADSLPDGIDTPIGGAERPIPAAHAQQVALARLLCADPAVVVLDEATADLSAAAAGAVERHLGTALAGRTVVVIAHRLDTAARADRVVVVDGGTVVATGTHDDLVATPGPYAAMWAHWTADRGLGS